MGEEHKITAKDKLILTIVLITIFVGIFGLGLIGEAKIVLFDLLDGTFYKEFNGIAVVMVGIFILSIVVFGIQIPKTIKELKNN